MIVINETDFRQRFGDDWRYDILINHDLATQRWKDIFESWKSRGLID